MSQQMRVLIKDSVVDILIVPVVDFGWNSKKRMAVCVTFDITVIGNRNVI